jgi:hypothetical protein
MSEVFELHGGIMDGAVFKLDCVQDAPLVEMRIVIPAPAESDPPDQCSEQVIHTYLISDSHSDDGRHFEHYMFHYEQTREKCAARLRPDPIALAEQVKKLEQQRDGLLAACKAAIKLDDRVSNPDFYSICQCSEVGYFCSSCVRHEIEAAIAKAEGR